DPRELRAEIARLKKELGKKLPDQLTPERESEIRKEAARSAHSQYLEPLRDAVLSLEAIRQGADRLDKALHLAHDVARFIDVITEPKRPNYGKPEAAKHADFG